MPAPPQLPGYAYLTLTWSEWAAFPEAVRRAIQCIGREYPQGMGKPVIIEIPSYRLPELLEIARANGMEMTE